MSIGTNKTPLQSNFQTNQNFNIDINKIFSDFIQEIDASRSISNLNFFVTGANKAFKLETIASLGNLLKIESTPQESRAHCFYRLIGFPVISQGGSGYYNPGLDSANQANLANKITIANHVDPAFLTLSLLRENYNNGILNDFNAQPPTLTSAALALTSSIHTRSFSVPITSTAPYSFAAADQQYTANLNSIVGQNQVLLTDYTDETGVIPNTVFAGGKEIFATGNRYHFIKPFMVDPRIDFTINPAFRRVAVPFVASKKNLMISENTYIKRPLIEKVIRDRFASTQDAVVSPSQQQVIDYVLNVSTVKNDKLIQQMVTNIYNQGSIGPIVQFEKFLFIIQAMCTALVKAQLKIQLMQSRYYWLPLPSSIGPEGGSEVKSPIISSALSSTLITPQDQAIINLSLSQISNTFDTQTATTNGVPDLGNFAFDAFHLTFNSDTSTSLGDNVTTELTTLLKKRTADLTVANGALQTIEIIMGEWSGLGLCDIVAIMGSLYVMPGDKVLGFLDSVAQQRAMEQGILPTGTFFPNITETQQSFIDTAANFYHLMDDIYKNIAQDNGLNT
jgi:hypothetical protein